MLMNETVTEVVTGSGTNPSCSEPETPNSMDRMIKTQA
jgi:hypothetical protein